MKNSTIAIVEDDDEIREGLAFTLTNSGKFSKVDTYGSAEDALKDMKSTMPDIVLMDIGLPRMSGIECLRRLKQVSPEVQVVMLTVFEEDDQVFDSIVAGASGYLLKKTPPKKLLEHLRDLQEGAAPVSGQIARRILEVFRTAPTNETEGLSKREVDVLNHLAKGYSHKQIADKLFISPETVRWHLKHIYQKLHVHSKTEAVAKVFHVKSKFPPFG